VPSQPIYWYYGSLPSSFVSSCLGLSGYVLDPKLQAGQKIPRWQPRSRQGIFVGSSNFHSSEVPLVLNLQTGSITPQFHVVFDNYFLTVLSISPTKDPPDLCLEHSLHLHTDALDHNNAVDFFIVQNSKPRSDNRSSNSPLCPRVPPILMFC
jgi:hypothetical protein